MCWTRVEKKIKQFYLLESRHRLQISKSKFLSWYTTIFIIIMIFIIIIQHNIMHVKICLSQFSTYDWWNFLFISYGIMNLWWKQIYSWCAVIKYKRYNMSPAKCRRFQIYRRINYFPMSVLYYCFEICSQHCKIHLNPTV